jgi:hypothetical protein
MGNYLQILSIYTLLKRVVEILNLNKFFHVATV